MPTIDPMYKLRYEIDSNLVDPNRKVMIAGHEITMGELHDLLPAHEKRFRMYIDFEDILMHTAVGFHSILTETLKFESNFDFWAFIKRTDNPIGFDYVHKTFLPNLNKSTIRAIYERYFPEICSRSPKTPFFDRCTRIGVDAHETLVYRISCS